MLVVAAAGGALVASRGTHARYEQARERAFAGCRAYRASPGHANADVCRTDAFARPLDSMKRARDAIADAKKSAARRDVLGFAGAIARALDRANEEDDRGSTISAMIASRIVADVLDVLDANASLLDEESRRALLARAHLRAAAHPFEAERVHEMWLAAEQVGELRVPPVFVVSEARATEAIVQADVTLAEMDRAVLDGDVGRCERAATHASGSGPIAFMGRSCARMREIVAVGERLERARAGRAAAPPCAAR